MVYQKRAYPKINEQTRYGKGIAMKKDKLVSLIIPCYFEEAAVPLFYQATAKVMDSLPQYDFELIFVDDGSRDNTLTEIKKLSAADNRVKYLSFSRIFGKESAMYAGMEYAKGNYIATMDVDLQDPPELLPEMLRLLETGEYDCVATKRVSRKGEPPIRSFFARAFYKIINKISQTEIVDGARDFRLMTRQMVNSVLQVKEYSRFSKGIFSWVGYRTKWLEFQNTERIAGETKWSFWKLFLYSIDSIIAFSTVPLLLASVLGVVFCLISFLAIIVITIRELIWQGSAYGWPSLVCIIFLLSGIQLFCMGIQGQYISKTYMETKNRPKYIIKEQSEDSDE